MFETERKSDTFQSFLSVLTPKDVPWSDVQNRVLSLPRWCLNASQMERDLALALAKYDHNGAPSNWLPVYHHEDHIKDWTDWCLVNTSRKKIDTLIEDFRGGFIPDAFEEMIQYCT